MSPWTRLARPIMKALGLLDLEALYSIRSSGALVEDGWFRSYKAQASVDLHGEPLPWITYPAIDFLRRRVKPEWSVFEYGAGNSTLWWAARVREVVSVEHDRAWAERLMKIAPHNVEVHHVDLVYGGDYSRKAAAYSDRFEVVVVDGRDRVNCIRNSLGALTRSGVLILDNSDRPAYSEGLRILTDAGFRAIEFTGLSPIVNLRTETSIFYRSSNCMGL